MALNLPKCIYQPVLALVVALLPAACGSDAADAAYRDYLERLGRTLAVAPAPPPTPVLPAPPRSGALQLVLDSANINALDFLALHGCALQVNIGRRNSSLGRLARPSQTLLLELEFLRLAPDCIGQLLADDKTALARQLESARQLKQTQLPARIFNATLGSDEYRAFWRAARPAGEFPAVPDAVTLQALHAITAAVTRWLGGDYSVDGFEFELLLAEVAGGNGSGLLVGLQQQARWLGTADRLLQARGERGPLCGANLRHAAADILPNVVQKYFVAQIQPGAAALQRSYLELLPPVRKLEDQLESVLPPGFRSWRDQREDILRSGSEAPRRHVLLIQSLLEPCS